MRMRAVKKEVAWCGGADEDDLVYSVVFAPIARQGGPSLTCTVSGEWFERLKVGDLYEIDWPLISFTEVSG